MFILHSQHWINFDSILIQALHTNTLLQHKHQFTWKHCRLVSYPDTPSEAELFDRDTSYRCGIPQCPTQCWSTLSTSPGLCPDQTGGPSNNIMISLMQEMQIRADKKIHQYCQFKVINNYWHNDYQSISKVK